MRARVTEALWRARLAGGRAVLASLTVGTAGAIGVAVLAVALGIAASTRAGERPARREERAVVTWLGAHLALCAAVLARKTRLPAGRVGRPRHALALGIAATAAVARPAYRRRSFARARDAPLALGCAIVARDAAEAARVRLVAEPAEPIRIAAALAGRRTARRRRPLARSLIAAETNRGAVDALHAAEAARVLIVARTADSGGIAAPGARSASRRAADAAGAARAADAAAPADAADSGRAADATACATDSPATSGGRGARAAVHGRKQVLVVEFRAPARQDDEHGEQAPERPPERRAKSDHT